MRGDFTSTSTPWDVAASTLSFAGTGVHTDSASGSMWAQEQAVLAYSAKGHSFDEIARLMGLSRHTVETCVKRIHRKLQVHAKTEALFEARAQGLMLDRGCAGGGCRHHQHHRQPGAAHRGRGLHFMAQRAALLGAGLQVVSSPSQGTLVQLRLPLQRPVGHASPASTTTGLPTPDGPTPAAPGQGPTR